VLVPVAMNKIPLTSQISIFNGIWFVFRDGDREIAAHCSILGLERTFVNGRLIFKKRSFSKTSNYQFDFDGNLYEVLVLVYKLETTQTECSLTKDGICIEKFKAYYKIDRTPMPIGMQLLIVIIGLPILLLFIHITIFFKISIWLYFVVSAISIYSFPTVWVIRKRLKFIIETIR
jgi:hypothetical protein